MKDTEKELTLREYMLIGYNGDLENLFQSDEAVVLAERWDAKVFVRQFFGKGLNEVRKKDVRLIFKEYVKKLSLELQDYSESDESFIDGNNQAISGGTRKLKLRFNDNFEIDYSDEF